MQIEPRHLRRGSDRPMPFTPYTSPLGSERSGAKCIRHLNTQKELQQCPSTHSGGLDHHLPSGAATLSPKSMWGRRYRAGGQSGTWSQRGGGRGGHIPMQTCPFPLQRQVGRLGEERRIQGPKALHCETTLIYKWYGLYARSRRFP